MTWSTAASQTKGKKPGYGSTSGSSGSTSGGYGYGCP